MASSTPPTPLRGLSCFFSYRSMGVSAPAWITEAERRQSEEPAPPASYPGAPWTSAVGFLIHRGGSTRGHYEHPVMPFSLCNAQATFQYSVNAVLRDLLHSYATVYLDNILVFCTSWEVCIEGIQDIFYHMQQCWLCVKLKKCWSSWGNYGQHWLAHRLQGDWWHLKLAAPF